jgi:hypothetical protein
MSLNRIILNEALQPILYEGETSEYSIYNVSVSYENGSGFPGAGEQFDSIKGTIILTNLRVLYIPINNIAFKSFSVPLQNMLDGKLSNNWIKGSTYTAAIKSVPHEGFSKEWGSIKLGFEKEGDRFQSYFLHLRSRIGRNE